MENLNNAEFGSDKNQEEAPILVAQRYLNIFRQIHIFSKEKRDQFDDELLALPQNILDFYKRMPGGRLLFEHIEEVKTARGISFVKMNKDDFAYDTGGSSGGNAASGDGGTSAPVAGGNLVMDASFAETFAQSMAAAFKGLPAATPLATGATSNVAVSADFGNAFDVIAEEIRTSRASLLDVLKETRNITDTVIASQVSISRVLEGLLASKNRDETDVANINNKIIASQASITKLLEGLYSANATKNEEISNYLSIDNKLQDFRNDLTQTIMGSLSGFADRASPISDEDRSFSYDIEGRLSAFRSEIKADVNKSLSEIKKLLSDFVQNENSQSSDINSSQAVQSDLTPSGGNWSSVAQTNSENAFEETVDAENQKSDSNYDYQSINSVADDVLNEHPISENSERKKKKKKKKKKNLDNASLMVSTTVFATNTDTNDSVLNRDDASFIEDSLDGMDSLEEIQNEVPLSEADMGTIIPTKDTTIENAVQSSIAEIGTDDDISDILSDLDNINAVDLNLSDGESKESETDKIISQEKIFSDDLDAINDITLSDNNIEETIADAAESVSEDSLPDDLDAINDITLSDDNIEETIADTAESVSEDSLPDDLDAINDITLSDNNIEETIADAAESVSEDSLPDDLDAINDITLSNNDESAPSQIDIADSDISLDDFSNLLNTSDNPVVTESDESVAEFSEQAVTAKDQSDSSDLDSFLADEEQTSSASKISDLPKQDFSALDDLISDDLDFTLPEKNNNSDVNSNGIQQTEASAFVSDDGLDFALPENSEDTTLVSEEEDLTQESVSDFSEIQNADNLDNNDSSSTSEAVHPSYSSRYSAELDKIREALTSDNIDLASLDQPIALDDYSDDENVSDEDDNISSSNDTLSATESGSSDDDWEYEYVEDTENGDTSTNSDQSNSQNSGDWEWEYVDENGNPAPVEGTESDEDWEWEYVEDDEVGTDKNSTEDDNNKE